MTSSDAQPPRSGAGIVLGFLLVALVDLVACEIVVGPVPGGAAVRVQSATVAALHVVAAGALVAGAAHLGGRLLARTRRRRWLAPAVVFAAAFVAGWGVLVEDFSPFPPPLRALLLAGVAVPFALVVAVFGVIARHRVLGAAAIAIAIAATIAAAFVVDGQYPGCHIVAHTLAGLLAASGIASFARVDERSARGRWLTRGTWAFGAVAVAVTAAFWPSNAVRVALDRRPSAGVVRLLARLHEGGEGAFGAAETSPAQEPWFRPRAGLSPLAPTAPRLAEVEPIVILLTCDALRADLLTRDEPEIVGATKNLRALARQGASFVEARSAASSTSPAIGAMFTGKYYSSLRWTEKELGGKLKPFLGDEKTPRFPEILRRAGVDTRFLAAGRGMTKKWGIARGMKQIGGETAHADEVTQRLIAWIEEPHAGPAFVWAHVMDAHAPYGKKSDGGTDFERYLKDVAKIDRSLKKLVAAVRASPLSDRTYVVVTADHGEAFGEHGTQFHAVTVYEELVRIPLVVLGPGVRARKIREPVSLIDLFPTMLDLYGRETPPEAMGQSLVGLLAGRDVELQRPIVVDSGKRKQAMIFRDGIKAIRNVRERTTEIYDLARDPAELDNLVEARPDLARSRLGTLGAFFDAHELRAPGYTIPAR